MDRYLDIENIHNGWNEVQSLIIQFLQKYKKENNNYEPTITTLALLTELSEDYICSLFPTKLASGD